jgi:hypothetical protein
MVDATCATYGLIEMVDVTCDTHDLMVYTYTTKDMVDDSLASHDMELYSELMKINLVEDESRAEARIDNNNNKCGFEVVKEKINEEHREVQNDIFKMIVEALGRITIQQK